MRERVEKAFWENLEEQVGYGPSVDFDRLLWAVLEALPPTD